MNSDDRAVEALAELRDASGPHARATRDRLLKAIASGDEAQLVGATAAAEGIVNEFKEFDEVDEFKTWSGAAHPRAPKGSATGGQFIAASGGGAHAQAAAGASKLLGKPLTDANIRAFQRAHGLQVDGKIGRQTAAALLGSKGAAKLKPGVMSDAQRRALAKYIAVRGSVSTPAPPTHKAFDSRERRDRRGRWTSGAAGAAASAAENIASDVEKVTPPKSPKLTMGKRPARRNPLPGNQPNPHDWTGRWGGPGVVASPYRSPSLSVGEGLPEHALNTAPGARFTPPNSVRPTQLKRGDQLVRGDARYTIVRVQKSPNPRGGSQFDVHVLGSGGVRSVIRMRDSDRPRVEYRR